MQPIPFKIHVTDDVLTDLQERLARVRWPDEVEGSGWGYGSDLAYVRELVDYWRTRYDWRKHEAHLNSFPHFTVPIGENDLHFIHQPGVGPTPLPLLLLHGWPGSVWEFHKLIPLLTDPARFGGDPEDAFTVVAPSLPGYSFSYRPGQPRLNLVQMADAFATLMTDMLGYERFAAQGGDIGARIIPRLPAAYPERVVGIHLNFVGFLREISRPDNPTAEEQQYLAELAHWQTEDSAYGAIQGTRPQTLAYGLTDSPVGLAAWIVEKFRAWSDCDGNVERVFTKDEMLTNIMLYWVTGAINSSFWPYYTSRHGDWSLAKNPPLDVPMAYAAFPHEIMRPPRSIVERKFNVQRWTAMPHGGHFAALEQPEALAEDMRAFFRPLRAK